MGYINLTIPNNISIATIDIVSSKNSWCKLISSRDNKESWFCFNKKPKKGQIIKFEPKDITIIQSNYKKSVKWIKQYETIK